MSAVIHVYKALARGGTVQDVYFSLHTVVIGGTQIITNTRKTHLFYKIIHFSVQFSAPANIFIVKA